MSIKTITRYYRFLKDMNLDDLALDIQYDFVQKPAIEIKMSDINVYEPIQFYFLCCGNSIVLKSNKNGVLSIEEKRKTIPIFDYIANLTTDYKDAVHFKYLASNDLHFKSIKQEQFIIRVDHTFYE